MPNGFGGPGPGPGPGPGSGPGSGPGPDPGGSHGHGGGFGGPNPGPGHGFGGPGPGPGHSYGRGFFGGRGPGGFGWGGGIFGFFMPSLNSRISRDAGYYGSADNHKRKKNSADNRSAPMQKRSLKDHFLDFIYGFPGTIDPRDKDKYL